MNYYQFHIGDYLSATAHLTLLEHGAYRRLLDIYYINEKPLPMDQRSIYRLAGARSKEEREAVDSVLSEYFEETDDGWRHDRCEHEISLCNKNRTNGKKGGRPPKSNSQDETQTKPRNNPDETQTKPRNNPDETQTESPPSPQYPNTQILKTLGDKSPLSGKPDGESSPERKKLSAACAEVLEFLNQKAGRNYRPVKANITLIAARLKEGATVDECRQVIAKKCREWRDDPTREIYLRPKTLFNATNFANYQGELVT